MDHALTPNPLRGIGFKLMSVAVFMAMSSCVKALAADMPTGEVVFFRSAFAIPVILVWLWYRHELREGLSTDNPLGHVWRGLMGASAMGLGFLALGLLPLPEVVAIGYATPLLVTVFAAMFLGETIRLYRLGAVLIGLIGVVVMLYPRLSVLPGGAATSTETVGALAVLMASVFAALAVCFVRRLVQTESTSAIVFWFSVTCSVLALLTLPFGWDMPTPVQAGLLVASGLLGGVGQILVTSSYRLAPASLIAPFDYSSILLAMVVGWFVFGEAPTMVVLIGAAVVTGAGLFVIWREHRLGLERGGARKVMTPQG